MDWGVWLLSDSGEIQKDTYKALDAALVKSCAAQAVPYHPILFQDLVMAVERGQLKLYMKGRPLSGYPQVVYFRGHTPGMQMDGEVTVLRHLEKMGCRVVNRLQPILKCINKFWTFQELAGHGIPLPDTLSYGGHSDLGKMIELGESQLSFPLVVKNTRGCRGNTVFLAPDKQHLLEIQHLLKTDHPYILQKYIEESHGCDVRVMVIGGQVVASVKRNARDGKLQSNFCQGAVSEVYTLDKEGRDLAVHVSRVLGMDICAIDLLMREDGSLCVCEVNSNPGFLPISRICNLDMSSLIAQHVLSLLPQQKNSLISPQATTAKEQATNHEKAYICGSLIGFKESKPVALSRDHKTQDISNRRGSRYNEKIQSEEKPPIYPLDAFTCTVYPASRRIQPPTFMCIYTRERYLDILMDHTRLVFHRDYVDGSTVMKRPFHTLCKHQLASGSSTCQPPLPDLTSPNTSNRFFFLERVVLKVPHPAKKD
ncbi:beta-citrylglutamate synthase B-like [Discoglossus pictus]